MRHGLLKSVVLTAVVVMVGYVGYYAYIDIVYSYDVGFSDHLPCPYLFSDTAGAGIESAPITHSCRSTDTIYTCIYRWRLYIAISKIPALKNVDLNDIQFNRSVSLSDVHLIPAEKLGSGLYEEIKLGPFFKHSISVDVDDYSRIDTTFSDPDYRGFFGTIDKMAFENGHGQILAMTTNDNVPKPAMLILYKAYGDFYMIIVHSDKPFSTDALKLFNLN